MKKYCHYLKTNKTTSFPHEMVFFDTETKTVKETKEGKEQELKLYTAVYYRRRPGKESDKITWTQGLTQDELALFVLNYCRNNVCLHVLSANIWFDLRVSDMLNKLLRSGFKVKACFVNANVFIMKLRSDKRSIRLLNIQNILPVSVKKIGEIIGLKKLEVDFNTVSDKDLFIYCKRDTEIIFKAMRFWFKFVQDNKLGSFAPTLASQAFNAYRHRFMTSRIAIHDNVKAHILERSGYFGGRTECFFIGKVRAKKVYTLDVNSMYPFVMQTCYYPYRLRYYSRKASVDKLYRLTESYCCMAICLIETDEPVYAKHYNEKTVFPVGKFVTTLCTGSFRYAYEHGHIKKVYEATLYCKAKIFEKWVKELHPLRKRYIREDNKTMSFMVKRMMNSLYGKFGQKTDEIIEEKNVSTIDYYIERHYDENLQQWLNITHVGNLYRVSRSKVNESFHSFPAIAAHVTDYARLYLWQLMKKAIPKNVFYVDTDGLYCNRAGYNRLKELEHKDKLGMLKLEKIADSFIIYGPKDYELDSDITLKGIPKSAKKIDNTTYECDMFPGMKRDLQKGMTDNYIIELRTKHLKRDYTKGIVNLNGSVSPFSLTEF